jgi:radical SAM protein with 4Fe4S-binding SPASM domain
MGWRALIAQLAPHTYHLKLTGGEPTLHPDFGEILAAVSEHNISCVVFTNGRWENSEHVMNLLKDTPTCDGLLISLHGPDATTHEAFSGVPGSFAETTANIRRATEAGVDVATSLVITKHNWHQIEATLKLALELGANYVVCNRWIGAPQLDLAPEPKHLRAAMATIESLCTDGQAIRFGNCIPQCFAPSSSSGCTAGTTFATIDPWGRVRPCNHAPLIAGDLHTQSIAEIWQGAVMKRWREMIPAGCSACPAFSTCHGGCRAQALLSSADQDPLTQMPFPPPAPEETVQLWAGLRPVRQFTQREERGQELLIHKNQVAVVPLSLYPMLPHLDGSLTLEQIQATYGTEATDWVGTLAQAGFITWK